MKLTWKKNKKRPLPAVNNLPFENHQDDNVSQTDESHTHTHLNNNDPTQVRNTDQHSDLPVPDATYLSKQFQAEGDKLAEEGNYREALGKWETAITLTPEVAALHEQKAQVLLEIGDAWNALKAATRATELEPSWAEAWVTLGRAQLNFGEPDSAIESFDRALAVKPDSEEARDDRKTSLHLVKKRKQLQSSGLSVSNNRYAVGDKSGDS
ncbi:hypothetical protein L6164_030427 [Bauhinia variegata]|uniref:Uncharacterized protein n=1 Tax=Bauhinia variegata TaxID=167791 RepID=A0ACB9LCP2_BAUVA|nr:hypothetical protein L6164_030427 [Bauhinia variegata]